MIRLYQIGDVVIHFQPNEEDNFGIKVKPQSASGDAINFFWPRGDYETSRKRIRGSVYIPSDQPFNQLVQKLRSMAGQLVDIIGYEFLDCCGCPCDMFGAEEILWVQTAGQVTDVDENESKDDDTISIEISHNPVWQPVNRVFWAFDEYVQNLFTTCTVDTIDTTLLNPYPGISSVNRFGAHTRLWTRYRYNGNIAYDPDLWDILHTDLRDYYPATGYGFTWQEDAITYVVSPDKGLWGAPPLSVYGFTNLSQSGLVAITVEREKHLYDTETVVSQLNLADLHAAMGTYGGLQTTDILILGDVYRPSGFVIRAGTILTDVLPKTQASVPFGRLIAGVNKISIEPAASQYAALHTFRRF